jgi:hypothetical protein
MQTKSIYHRLRAPIIGAILIPINCYWVIKCEIVISSIHATVLSIFFNVIFTLFVLSLFNNLIGRFSRKNLSSDELLIIYIMLAVATGLFGIDLMTLLVPIMGHSTWFATPENEWKELFSSYLPKDLVVTDMKVLKGYYEGETSFWKWENISAWIRPMSLWLVFIMLLFTTMIFINVILRKGWVEHEKLSYPVIQLPMEMSSGNFYKNKMVWIGFGLAFVLDMFAGLHVLFPAIPAPRVKWYNLAPFFNTRPWNAIDWLPVHFYPFATGLGYMMPLELSFSLWFFYLFWKLQLVFASAVGWRIEGAYLSWEKGGSWLGLGLMVIWTSRKTIKQVIINAIKGKTNDGTEPIGYRTAIIGLILCFTAIIIFWAYFGINPYAGIIFFALYMIYNLTATRMRAELGPPTHELHFVGPDKMMTAVLGSKNFSAETLSGFALLYWTNYGYRCTPMPHQLEGFKIAEQERINPKTIFRVEVIALAIGAVSAFLVLLSLFYKYGAVVKVHGGSLGPGWEAYGRLATLLSSQEYPDRAIIGQAGFGFLFTIFLMIMRRMFLWWKLHPVGFAVASGWSISWMWFSIFLGWLCKGIILKTGGMKSHRKAVPFFLGMILGQMIIGSIWSIVGFIMERGIYSFFV